jgi:hypothetical protein
MTPTTVQQERRELWNAILDEVAERDPDPARAAACSYLLDHLMRSAAAADLNASPFRRGGAYRFTGTTSSKMFCGN